MSLFPAYSSHEPEIASKCYRSKVQKNDALMEFDAEEVNKCNEDLNWLKNSSCPAEVVITNVPAASSLVKNLEESNFSSSDDTGINKEDNEVFKRKRSRSGSTDYKSKLKKSKKHKSIKHKKSKSKRKSRSRSREPCFPSSSTTLPLKNGNTKVFLDGIISSIKPEDALYIDLTGEQTNRAFDCTHYSQTAKYKKLKRQLPLGSRKYKSKSLTKDVRYFKKYFVELSGSLYVCCRSDEDDLFHHCREYIRISSKSEEKSSANTLSNPLGILDPATDSYLQGKPKINSSTESTIDVPIQFSFLQQKVKDYNERLAKEPQNVQLWLEFIKFQDELCDSNSWDSEDKSESGSKKSSKAQIVERKLSIIDTAIKKNYRNLCLRFERLKTGHDLWSKEQLNTEWNKLVSNFPNNMEVWYRFIIFYQTSFSSYSLRSAIGSHIKCVSRLIQMQNGKFLSHSPPPNIGFRIIDLTTQLAFLWQQGGYMERTVALFQALIEFNLFCPQFLKENEISFEDKISIFEAFWDTRAPRFGELDSVGWSEFMKKKQPVKFLEEILEGTQDEEDEILSKGGAKSKLWIELESSREANHWLPWQQDPDNCEDPERMVSFMDIKKHIIEIKSEKECFYLLVNFLSFLRVNVPEVVLEHCFDGETNSAFLPLRLETLRELRYPEPGLINLEAGDDDLYFFPCVGPSSQKLPDSFYLFVCRIIDRSYSLFSLEYKKMLVILQIRLYRDRCLFLIEIQSENAVAVVTDCKSKIKNLMKQHEYRNDLGIYLEFALFESSLGLHDNAVKIHEMSIASQLNGNLFDTNETSNSAVLMRHLVSVIKLLLQKEVTLQNGSQILAVQNIICSILNTNSYSSSAHEQSSTLILRSKNKANEIKFLYLQKSEMNCPESLNCIVFLLALLQLFTSGLQSSCLVYEEVLENLSDRSDDGQEKIKSQELLYENYIWLLHLGPLLKKLSCMQLSPFNMKNIMKKAVKTAPNNLFLLCKLSKCKFQVWREIHSFIKTIDDSEKSSILVVIFQLIPHIRRTIHYMSEGGGDSLSHQLMSILETCVNTDKGKHCPLLWRLYLRLVHSLQPTHLKNFIYRAINGCPSAKCVYMDCIRFVPSCTNDILRIMEEKGIRIRLPLEELDVLLENEEVDEDTLPMSRQQETSFVIDCLPELTIESVTSK